LIVDVHTHCLQPDHLSPSAQKSLERAGYPPMQPLPPEVYDRDMAVVDRAIVFGIRGAASGVRTPNDFTVKWVGRNPEKLLGFMALDPMEDDHMEEFERCLDLGLRGVKIYPMLGRYDPTDPTHFPLYEKAQRLGLPILAHTGTHPDPRAMLKYSHPLLIDEIAQAFPELKFVMAHLAHPWQRDCALVLRKHPNVYADISGVWVRPWQGWEAMTCMIEWGATDKLLFGSDYPLWTPQEAMDGLRRLNDQLEGTRLPRIPEEVIDGILQRDALDLLGLD